MEFDQRLTKILSGAAIDFDQIVETRDFAKALLPARTHTKSRICEDLRQSRLQAHQFLLAILMPSVVFENEL
jgi:hypothetical protein